MGDLFGIPIIEDNRLAPGQVLIGGGGLSCGCVLIQRRGTFFLGHCPLHAAAPKLLEMLEVYANKNCSWGYSESQGAHTGNIWTCPEEECAPAREAIKEARPNRAERTQA